MILLLIRQLILSLVLTGEETGLTKKYAKPKKLEKLQDQGGDLVHHQKYFFKIHKLILFNGGKM